MTLPLTDPEYQSIRSLYKSTKDKRVATYLNIILLKHKLYPQIEIADILNIDENTVCTWVKKFESSVDITQYLTNLYVPYLGKLTYSLLGKVDNLIENGTFSDTKPIISAVKERFKVQYSISGITKLVKRLGFTYKEKVGLPSKLDKDKQLKFVKEYELIQDNLTNECAIFFMDAVHRSGEPSSA
jgi:transposase